VLSPHAIASVKIPSSRKNLPASILQFFVIPLDGGGDAPFMWTGAPPPQNIARKIRVPEKCLRQNSCRAGCGTFWNVNADLRVCKLLKAWCRGTEMDRTLACQIRLAGGCCVICPQISSLFRTWSDSPNRVFSRDWTFVLEARFNASLSTVSSATNDSLP
jgi:hypothetical protein